MVGGQLVRIDWRKRREDAGHRARAGQRRSSQGVKRPSSSIGFIYSHRYAKPTNTKAQLRQTRSEVISMGGGKGKKNGLRHPGPPRELPRLRTTSTTNSPQPFLTRSIRLRPARLVRYHLASPACARLDARGVFRPNIYSSPLTAAAQDAGYGFTICLDEALKGGRLAIWCFPTRLNRASYSMSAVADRRGRISGCFRSSGSALVSIALTGPATLEVSRGRTIPVSRFRL